MGKIILRKSPAKRGYVADGTIEKGEDGNYWDRRAYGNKGHTKWFKVSDYENRRLKNEESEIGATVFKVKKPKAKTKPKVTKPTIEEGKRAIEEGKRAKESYEKFIGVKLF